MADQQFRLTAGAPNRTLSELEREAWQRGDAITAEVLAQAAAKDDAIVDLSGCLETIADILTETNWRTGKKTELAQALADIAEQIEKYRDIPTA